MPEHILYWFGCEGISEEGENHCAFKAVLVIVMVNAMRLKHLREKNYQHHQKIIAKKSKQR